MLHIVGKIMKQGFHNAKTYKELSYELEVIGKQKGESSTKLKTKLPP